MISDSEKIQIAKKFAELYQTQITTWTPTKDYLSDDDRYLTIYDSLIMGVYGDCYGVNAEYDEDDNLIQEATEFEVEIEGFGSTAEQAEVFSFEITSELAGVGKFIEDHGRHGDW
ncbi:MAG: hypothetical protein Q7U18_06125 [Methylobacter sp.]|nr:hypothetical protein [Methylobacter sp.]